MAEPGRHLLRLTVKGADSLIGSSLCATCPHSPAGCCVAPPRYDWSDIGRVVHHGGIDFLLDGLARGRLVPCDNGLYIRRPKGRVVDGEVPPRAPRIAKCSFHDGGRGCTIDPTSRPATCNFYICESALAAGVEAGGANEVARARTIHDALVTSFVAWDEATARRIRELHPGGPTFDRTFLEWLGETYAEHLAEAPPAVG